MRQKMAALLPALAGLALLTGCDWMTSTSVGGGSGVAASGGPATNGGGGSAPSVFGGVTNVVGTDDVVIATPSTDKVSVVVGSTRTFSISLNSSDGRAMSGFQISGTLGALPAGWSGPKTFACATVSAGNGCVLNLTYAPTAVASGTFTVGYVVIDNAGLPRTDGSVTVAYEATPSNHVLASASPTGQITALQGAGATSVDLSFFTDDGNPATSLALVTDLSQLPTGWSSAQTNWGCAVVSTGSGCRLMLSFAATAPVSGTLTLDYSYVDEAGVAETGTVNLPYFTATTNQVIATASPGGQIVAAQPSGGQTVSITFTTDDGKPATKLALTSALGNLPAGWSSSVQSFSCAGLSTGNGCQLPLQFAPTALGNGVVTLEYAYTDGAGMPRTGVINIPYAATTNDNVAGVAAPAGEIDAVVGTGTVPVSVTFGTDDGRSATALNVTSDLTALPSGWSSSQGSFGCGAVDSVVPCTLGLTYAPTAAGTGTVLLAYSYVNNAGETKTGTVGIAYRATTDDNVTAMASASPFAVDTGTSNSLTITFVTDDGDAASALSASAALGALPNGWTGPGSFDCATVSAGTVCTLMLNYAPATDDAGTLTLPYTYTNDSGYSKNGTLSVNYTATTPPP